MTGAQKKIVEEMLKNQVIEPNDMQCIARYAIRKDGRLVGTKDWWGNIVEMFD